MASYRKRKEREFVEKYGTWRPYRPGQSKIVSKGPATSKPTVSQIEEAKKRPSISELTKPKGYQDMLKRAQESLINMERLQPNSVKLAPDYPLVKKKPIWTQSDGNNGGKGGGGGGGIITAEILEVDATTSAVTLVQRQLLTP